jgi:hypothetical protein
MTAEQSWRRQIQQAAFVLVNQAPALDTDMPLLARAIERRTQAPRTALDRIERLGLLSGADHGNAALDDSGLFSRDRLQRRAEKFGVIDPDR